MVRKILYDKNTRETASRLRKQSNSYGYISEKLKIPKSTLSNWLAKKHKNIFNKKAQLLHLSKIRPLAIEAKKIKNLKLETILKKKISDEIKNYPIKNLGLWKSMLAMLYWAEGAKYKGVSGLKFVNTDPKLILFYITLLRKCFNIDESRFRVRLHLHYYHNIKNAKNFWSGLTKIPLQQFGSIYIKRRSQTKHFRQNFMGICFISYLDSNIRRELLELANQLQESAPEMSP